MSHSPGGRDSPSSTASSNTASGSGSVAGSIGSGSNGCRNSGASFDSGRATSTTFQGVRYSGGALSSESSLGSLRHSYHSSNSSLGSLPSEEIRNFDVAAMLQQGVPDHEIINVWLTGIHLECYYQNFLQAGYDMHTISRMTPEDLNAIGVTKPHHRKKIKAEISQLNITEGLPDYIPESIEEWLRLLKLEEYQPKLIEQGYTQVRQVTNITWEDLDDIGIFRLGHQKKFMLAIKRVQNILAGKRIANQQVSNSYVSNADSMIVTNPNSHTYRSSTGLPYQQPSLPLHHSALVGEGGPGHNAVNNDFRLQLARNYQQYSNVNVANMQQKIQVHHQSGVPSAESFPAGVASQSSPQVVQPIYHPEVISIRVKNGHGNNSLDSPPEDEPIYGTSSFLPSSSTSSVATAGTKSGLNFKSYEDGETPTSNGLNNSSKAPVKYTSHTWTLPRLKHKPIAKVMGGGTITNCDASVTYPINPGPFAPQQVNPPCGPAPSVTTFIGKGPSGEFSSFRNCPPPPPRRSSCSSLGPNDLPDDNLSIPPPPSLSLGNNTFATSMQAHGKTSISGETNSNLMHGMSSSYYAGQPSTATSNYACPEPGKNISSFNSNGRSTLPLIKSRDTSPAGSEFSDPDLSNNGYFSKGVRRNGSDASFKSNSSTESESLPFANDNAGTIKQQKSTNRTISHASSTENSQDVEAGDVLSDIGSMLADLTDQLDAILEQERTSKGNV